MSASPHVIEMIKATWTQETFPAKTLLVKEGALAKKLFFLETGCVRCWFNTEAGREVTMHFGFEGSFISSMETIISGEPSWYSIETLEPAVAYSITLSEFKEKRAGTREFELAYYTHVEKRLLHYQKLFVSRIRDTPEERYRALLAQQPEIIQRIPQHYIASLLGITSVSLSRIRNRR